MKKMVTLGVAVVLAGSGALADDGVVMINQSAVNAGSPTEVSAEAALVSSYVWRGQVYNNDMVLQPQVTIQHYDVSLNLWGNYDLGSNNTGTDGDFSEIDFSLAYTLPISLNEMAVDVGLINYNFPNNGKKYGSGPGTTELFVKGTALSWQDYVVPSVTVFGDIDEADGIYVLFDVVAPYQISEYLAVEGGISAGYGNNNYNDYYFDAGDGKMAGWNDYNFYSNASYELMENVTLSANLTYTVLDGTLRDGGRANYEATRKLWGGVNVAYDF